MSEPKIELKSRRLSYYNYDKGITKQRVFSAIEIEQANSVFDTIENILIENNLEISTKYVSIGKCGCLKHDDTFFMVQVDSEELSISIISDIEDALEGLEVKFVSVVARHERRCNYLELVIIQKHMHGAENIQLIDKD